MRVHWILFHGLTAYRNRVPVDLSLKIWIFSYGGRVSSSLPAHISLPILGILNCGWVVLSTSAFSSNVRLIVNNFGHGDILQIRHTFFTLSIPNLCHRASQWPNRSNDKACGAEGSHVPTHQRSSTRCTCLTLNRSKALRHRILGGRQNR